MKKGYVCHISNTVSVVFTMLVHLLEIELKKKTQLGCRFDIMDNKSNFFVFWHMQLYMSWYIRSFFGLTFLNILYFFKYFCTNIFHRRSLYTFYLAYRKTPIETSHYNDVIMRSMASQITSLTIVYSTVYSRRRTKKKNPRYWPLWGEFTGNSLMTSSWSPNILWNSITVNLGYICFCFCE